ncbi:MAG: DegT/DnrJ/EryC1/StrS family aminotransferase [Myxococcota bacterium]|nr:DegT/DnrJ/EryC1/StrS family aminotransferase [Myxococcota bacterium]
MNIPFVDLKSQYQSIKADIDQAIASVVRDTAFVGGKPVNTFAKQYAEAMGVQHCIPVANGTDAIYISLKMAGIGPGDEVITVANSWISTSETISQTGATPVFVDIDDYYTIDVDAIEAKLTSNTKAIIPVHLYGQMADMPSLMELATRHNLMIIEDCAQAHLATFDDKLAGTTGLAGTFSFYPGKNLGAYGDAGCIITNDDSFAEACLRYANHGALVKHQHTIEGINSRLDGIQAAVLSAKLPHLEAWSQGRIDNAARYNELLAPIEQITTPKVRSNCRHVYHLYVVRTPQRDELRTFLSERGIATGIHYPTPLPLLPAYERLGHVEGDFPMASARANEILSLPMFPELTEDAQQYITDAIAEFFS